MVTSAGPLRGLGSQNIHRAVPVGAVSTADIN